MTTKKRTRTDRLAAHFLMRPGEFVSAYAVREFSPLGHRQEISRCRAKYGMRIQFEKRGKRRGYVFIPAKKKAAA